MDAERSSFCLTRDHFHDAAVREVARIAGEYVGYTGRWTTRDPTGFAGGDTNLYAYAFNDPVNFVDPDRRIPILAALGLAWAAAELGLSMADLLDFLDTLSDDCATGMDKLLSGGLFLGGMVGPGGGYNNLFDLLKHHPHAKLFRGKDGVKMPIIT